MSLYDPVPGGGISMRPIRLTEEASQQWQDNGDGTVSILPPPPPAQRKASKPTPTK